MNLKINTELRDLIRPLTDEERTTLRANIAQEGRILDPIRAWRAPDGDLVIVDGHNRYAAWEDLAGAIPEPAVVELDLPDLAAVKAWMRANQRGRRNISPDQQLMEDFAFGEAPKPSKTVTPLRLSQAKAVHEEAPDLARKVLLGTFSVAVAFGQLQARKGAPSRRKPRTPPAATAPAEPLDRLEEHRLQSKLAAEKRETKALLERLDRVTRERDAFRFLESNRTDPILAPRKVGGTQRSGCPVLLCSDWHVEEPVSPGQVDGKNEYNLEIADRCIDRLVEGYAWLMRDSRYDCRTGVIWLGGDLMSGFIHEELVRANELSPTQTASWLEERLERMLLGIADACPSLERIVVACNSGNHGRITKKIHVSGREETSYENMIYHNIARALRGNPRFDFRIATGEWLRVNVFGFDLAFSHGDSFQGGSGVGGLTIPLLRGLSRQFKSDRPHVTSIGHFHQRIDLGDVVVNGSMIGYSPYSQRIHAAPEPRQQTWFLVDSEKGKCLSAPVWL